MPSALSESSALHQDHREAELFFLDELVESLKGTPPGSVFYMALRGRCPVLFGDLTL